MQFGINLFLIVFCFKTALTASEHYRSLDFIINEKKENHGTETKDKFFESCDEAILKFGNSGVYVIKIPGTEENQLIYCELDPDGGTAWTVVQRNQQNSTINFFMPWKDYKYGFGKITGDFFIGLDTLHRITNSEIHELWIKLVDSENDQRSMYYSEFAIGSENQDYVLSVLGDFKGGIGDSLKQHAGQKFTTKDRDNDDFPTNCAETYRGGWWFHSSCRDSNLNGHYFNKHYQGIHWRSWHGPHSVLKSSKMAIRPVHH